MSRTAIITGASRGICAAVADRLSKDGFSVVVNYAGEEAEASAVADQINAAGARAITVKADVSSPAEVKRMFDLAEKEFGGVDILVNNAGIMSLATIAAADDAMFDRTISVNLKGTFKWAVGGFSDSLATEVAPFGVKAMQMISSLRPFALMCAAPAEC